MSDPSDVHDSIPYPAEPPLVPIERDASTLRRTNEDTLYAWARSGDRQAWDSLVERLQPSVWAAAGALGLSVETSQQVSRLAWLRLTQQMDAAEPAQSARACLLHVVEEHAERIAPAIPHSRLPADATLPHSARQSH
jgi:hypothetical protein